MLFLFKTCLNNNLLPKYTLFKIYDPAAQMENTTKMFRKHLIERQIVSAEAEICELNIEIKEIMESLQKNLSETQISHITTKSMV